MRRHGVTKLVFSSSATVYGHNSPPLTEDMSTAATNPYGWTKVMIEQILRDVAAADPDLRIALLRYFNPVGAHASGTIGEDPQGIPNNLMPFIAQVAVGRRDKLLVFGDDYPTPDGTCIRDYIHVEDLADAHLAVARRLSDPSVSGDLTVNIGRGEGVSVREFINLILDVTGHTGGAPVVTPRRPGDPARVVASCDLIRKELGWSATRDPRDMVGSAWQGWLLHHPQAWRD
jgi:UDP-glucose 4-epimerase